jgi:membrane protein implicated in regulation of membrane protease activity
MAWLWWIVTALLLGIAEMISLSLVLAMLGGGALAAALVALAGGPWWAQWLTMGVVAAVLLVTLRPWLLRVLRRRGGVVETNAAAIVGRTAVVVSDVDGTTGRVKLSGDIWSARCDTGVVIATGATVSVTRIDGAVAVVVPYTPPPTA